MLAGQMWPMSHSLSGADLEAGTSINPSQVLYTVFSQYF